MKNMFAKVCNSCFLCKYARNRPDSVFGKVMHWHGTWCPAWKAYEEIYGEKAKTTKGS